MKNIFFIVMALVSFAASAQELTPTQRKQAAEKVYAIFDSYAVISGLRDVSTNKTTDAVIRTYTGLFVPGALVRDDINAADTIKGDLTTSDKTVYKFVADVRANFPKGLDSKITSANISYKDIANRHVKIAFEHIVKGTTAGRKTFQSKDTMLMVIRFTPDYSDASIESISLIGGSLICTNCSYKMPEKKKDNSVVITDTKSPSTGLNKSKGMTDKQKQEMDDKAAKDREKAEDAKQKKKEDVELAKQQEKGKKIERAKDKQAKEENGKVHCPNDDDCDGVPNLDDECPNEPGPASNHGCPVKGTDGLAVGLSINIGGGGASLSAGNADISHLQYNNLTNASFNNIKYKVSGGVNLGAEVDLLFGKNKNYGISTGINYAASYGTAETEQYHVEFEATDAHGTSFRRILSANKITENLSSGNVSIPILFKLQTNPGKKLGLSLDIGPVISVHSSAKSNMMDANMDFEAVYAFINGQLGYSSQSSRTDWVLTRAAVSKAIGNDASVNKYFDNRYNNGYYVGLQKEKSGSGGSVCYKTGIGGLLRIGGVYRATQMVNVLFGLNTLIISNGHSSSQFTPLNANDDFNQGFQFQSFLKGAKALLTAQFGVNVGVQIRLTKSK